MPCASIERPALGLSLLKAGLLSAGCACDVRYLSIEFARRLGWQEYAVLTALPRLAMAGDWVFAEALWGDQAPDANRYVAEILEGAWRLDEGCVNTVLHARALASPYLDAMLAEHDWEALDLVGVSSVGVDNVAGLAFARRLKQVVPRLRIVFGGHNWTHPMGRTLHRSFPFVDFACLGEGDEVLPRLAFAVSGGREDEIVTIPGLLSWDAHGRQLGQAPQPVRDLDSLPTPDHSDFFRALDHAGLGAEGHTTVPLETSRGCWWAARIACAFCGVNGEPGAYRSKSAGRVRVEIGELAHSWPGQPLDVVDNLVSRRFVREVVARLLAERECPPLYFKVRPDVVDEDLDVIGSAGGSVMCGLESLNDRLLDLMQKGSGALENLRFLRRCRELGISVDWNLLTRLPGESALDYVGLVELMQAVVHLQPPGAVPIILVERYSAFWRQASDQGFGRLRPAAAYGHIYRLPESDLANLAYYFDHDYRPSFDVELQIRRTRKGVVDWTLQHPGALLNGHRDAAGVAQIRDSRRDGTPVVVTLSELETSLLNACTDIRSLKQLLEVGTHVAATGGDVLTALQVLVDRRFVVRAGDRFLSIVIWDGAKTCAPTR